MHRLLVHDSTIEEDRLILVNTRAGKYTLAAARKSFYNLSALTAKYEQDERTASCTFPARELNRSGGLSRRRQRERAKSS